MFNMKLFFLRICFFTWPIDFTAPIITWSYLIVSFRNKGETPFRIVPGS